MCFFSEKMHRCVDKIPLGTTQVKNQDCNCTLWMAVTQVSPVYLYLPDLSH